RKTPSPICQHSQRVWRPLLFSGLPRKPKRLLRRGGKGGVSCRGNASVDRPSSTVELDREQSVLVPGQGGGRSSVGDPGVPPDLSGGGGGGPFRRRPVPRRTVRLPGRGEFLLSPVCPRPAGVGRGPAAALGAG